MAPVGQLIAQEPQHTPSSVPIRAWKPAEGIFSLPSSANYPITRNQSRILGFKKFLDFLSFKCYQIFKVLKFHKSGNFFSAK